jgi:hypothetical protein
MKTAENIDERNEMASLSFVKPKIFSYPLYNVAVCASTLYAGILDEIGAPANHREILIYAPTILSAPFTIAMSALKKLNWKIMHHSIGVHYKSGRLPIPYLTQDGKIGCVSHSILDEANQHIAAENVVAISRYLKAKKDEEINYKKKSTDAIMRASLESIVCYSVGRTIGAIFK